MKKKIIIVAILCLILVVGIIGFVFWNNRTVSIITLDINPSIKITVNKDENVKDVIALNKDAKDIIDKRLKGKSLSESLNILADIILGKGYAQEDMIFIILYSKGEIQKEKLEETIRSVFEERQVSVDLIVIDEVSKEDEKLAKKYNVSPAKIAYIQSIVKDNDNISIEDFSNKPISEIKETKETGNYCDKGYTLEGDWCVKEIGEESPKEGKVCSRGYSEYENKCYLEGNFTETDTLVCYDDYQLNGDKCETIQISPTNGRCSEGEYDSGKMQCHVAEYYGDGELYCRITPGEDLLYNGRCLGRKPTINGGCLGSDTVINGWCYDTSASSGYEAEYRCPDGALMSIEKGNEQGGKCYRLTYKDADEIYCDEGYTIENGNQCIRRETRAADHEKICEDGFTLVKDGRCLNLNVSSDMVDGIVCDSRNARVEDNACIIYDMIGAKHN